MDETSHVLKTYTSSENGISLQPIKAVLKKHDCVYGGLQTTSGNALYSLQLISVGGEVSFFPVDPVCLRDLAEEIYGVVDEIMADRGEKEDDQVPFVPLVKRTTSKKELNDVVKYWQSLPRNSGHVKEGDLISFLHIFTPEQIMGAMYIATSKGRPYGYFKYLCGILGNWKKDLEQGKEPPYFKLK